MIRFGESGADDLPNCLRKVTLALPALSGRIVSDIAGETVLVDDLVRSLLDYWRIQYPEAGPSYWASRSWGMLTWQPAYLSVLCVHLSATLPTLDGMRQNYATGSIAGFTLPSHLPLRGDESALIREAGLQLQRLWPNWYSAFSRQQTYSRKQASCLLADCLLSALLLLPTIRPLWSATRLHEYAGLWLAASGLDKRSGLLLATRSDGRQNIDLNRQGCCQHFRRNDGEPCNTCPRRSPAERKALMLQQAACVV